MKRIIIFMLLCIAVLDAKSQSENEELVKTYVEI